MVPCTDQPLQIAILSGGTGRTASQVVNAALAQFERPHVRLMRFNQIATVADVRRIIRELPAGPLIIFHSLVSPAVSEAAVAEAKRRMVPAVDISGGPSRRSVITWGSSRCGNLGCRINCRRNSSIASTPSASRSIMTMGPV